MQPANFSCFDAKANFVTKSRFSKLVAIPSSHFPGPSFANPNTAIRTIDGHQGQVTVIFPVTILKFNLQERVRQFF